METIILYAAVLVLFASLPMLLDIYLAYQSLNKSRNLLIEKASVDKLRLEELRELVRASEKAPTGTPGLARATMALTVLVILGLAVLHLLIQNTPKDDAQIINNILSMLAGLLAAITGFYYGGKATERKIQEGKAE